MGPSVAEARLKGAHWCRSGTLPNMSRQNVIVVIDRKKSTSTQRCSEVEQRVVHVGGFCFWPYCEAVSLQSRGEPSGMLHFIWFRDLQVRL